MNNINVFHPGFADSSRRTEASSRTIGLFRLCLALAALLWSGAMVSLAGDTHYVSLAGTNDSVNGYTNGWVGAATNIQWAVNVADGATFDTVLVSNGTYNLTNQISITKNITVRSLYGTNDINTSSIINGNYPDYSNRCVYMSGSAAIHPVLDGFVISNGYRVVPWLVGAAGLADSGGGVQIDNGGYLLNSIVGWNKTFNSNVDYGGGGGIYLRPTLANYHVIVSNCYVVSNTVVDPGSGVRGGGGILAFYSGGKIIACRISGNQAYSGGGLYPNACIVSNCTVDGNLATAYNGGIYAYCGTIIANCVISNNVSYGDSGGIGSYSSPVILNSVIIGNRANNNYGGVYIHCNNAYGVGMLSNCQVIANIASNSTGGVYLYGPEGPGVVADCIIAGNVSKNNGGGLYVYTTTYSNLVKNCLIYGNTNLGAGGGGVLLNRTGPYPNGLINCTIAGNEAGTKGGGLYATTTNNYIANCIIYGNVTTNAGDNDDEVYVNTTGGTSNFWYNCTPTNLVLGQGNTTNNPLFINAGNRNYRLGSGSPCVNTGTNMNWMTNSIDLDRRIRIRYGTVDMGAYEAIYNGTMYGVR